MMTVIAVALLSELGGALLTHQAYRILSSLFLLALGCYYMFSYIVRRRRDQCCGVTGKGQPADQLPSTIKDGGATDGVAALSLIAMTSLSPCVGSMPVLLAFLEPPISLERLALSSAVLIISSAGAMGLFVALSLLGAQRLYFGRIRRHERLFLGISFILLAALTYFVFQHEDHGGHHGGHHDHAHHPETVMVRVNPTCAIFSKVRSSLRKATLKCQEPSRFTTKTMFQPRKLTTTNLLSSRVQYGKLL